ncbi:hypothetical protein ANCCAN_30395 [Ancylostoma caninum]|uniref:Uncharacterized protein n=1 Tax=Ancylostoma caninum TaxID=29170 RepID=A0A368EWC4_ANCCA|nr:hypothetical protein ANCCAN_30395 [Ancylostoma caninum]
MCTGVSCFWCGFCARCEIYHRSMVETKYSCSHRH